MLVLCQTWPTRNEWHNTTCSDCGILFCVKLSECKDVPVDPPPPPKGNDERWKTVSLLLRPTRKIQSIGGICVLDHGLCVLQVFVDIKRKGLYGDALTKKR